MFVEVHNVYGPYVNVHGRRTVIVDNGVFRKSMTYSRYLWIMHHKEIPPDGYVVDHIDNDPTNDVVENLQLLTSKENDDKWREYYKTIKDRPKGWASKKVGDLNVISEL